MECRDCKVKMVAGVGMVPVWGTLDGRPLHNGVTLSAVTSKLMPVMKCPHCGHSVYFGEILVKNQG
jgi:hypothetical protein